MQFPVGHAIIYTSDSILAAYQRRVVVFDEKHKYLARLYSYSTSINGSIHGCLDGDRNVPSIKRNQSSRPLLEGAALSSRL